MKERERGGERRGGGKQRVLGGEQDEVGLKGGVDALFLLLMLLIHHSSLRKILSVSLLLIPSPAALSSLPQMSLPPSSSSTRPAKALHRT